VFRNFTSIALLLFVFASGSIFGQTVRGSIFGRVTNSINQPVAGVVVTVVEEDTNQKRIVPLVSG
jgi:hypothetical protein